MEPTELEGIAAADALLGRPFPLPACALPLARWVEVREAGEGVEVAWNLDDSRPATPGRLALYAGPQPAPDQLAGAGAAGCETTTRTLGDRALTIRRLGLEAAQPSLRPVVEIGWTSGDLSLRLTGQGPWGLDELLALVAAVDAETLDTPR